jgi:neutral amino acid transport system permease protein
MDWGAILENGLQAGFGVFAVVFALAAMGLNVHFGYTGLLNFGQVGFMAVGGFGVAISVATWGWSLWAGLAVGLAASIVFALLLGVPTLRLRADYLAIVTIAASEIIRYLLRSPEFRETTGGSFGLTQFSREFYDLNPYADGRYGIGPINYGERTFWVITVGWALVALIALVIFLLMRSPWGRVLKSIREDEDAVRSLGKNVFVYKMQSLVFGGICGSLGGFVLALSTSSAQPDSYSTPLTFFAYVALILGGTARVFGPIVGSMVFWMVLSLTDNVLRQLDQNDYLPNWLIQGTEIGQVRFMLVGLALMLLMIYRPQGIFGDKRELALDAR